MANARRPRRFRFFFYLFIWLFTLSAAAVVTAAQISRYGAKKAELAEAEEEYAKTLRERDALLERAKYFESDAYVEEVAREQLGLMYPDEILFINVVE